MAKSNKKRRSAPGFTELLSSPLKSTSDSSGGKGSGVGRGAGTRTCSDRSTSIFCDDENSWWSEFSSVSPSCASITIWLLRCAIKHWAARKSANRDANNLRSGLTSCFFCGELLLLWRANIRQDTFRCAHLHTSLHHEERIDCASAPLSLLRSVSDFFKILDFFQDVRC